MLLLFVNNRMVFLSHTLLFISSFLLSDNKIRWHGKDRAEFLEHVVVGDIHGLASGASCLSLITNETGGILDDTVITNAGDHIYMVVNGATKHDDMAHFQTLLDSDAFVDKDIEMEYLGDDVQLLAVQGPAAAAVVSNLLDTNAIDLTKMPFMSGAEVTLAGIPGCRITRYVCPRPVCTVLSAAISQPSYSHSLSILHAMLYVCIQMRLHG
jgi:glycine cleavage system aminomethyltransferase T